MIKLIGPKIGFVELVTGYTIYMLCILVKLTTNIQRMSLNTSYLLTINYIF